jgi:uncharacterized cupin superfamily protein
MSLRLGGRERSEFANADATEAHATAAVRMRIWPDARSNTILPIWPHTTAACAAQQRLSLRASSEPGPDLPDERVRTGIWETTPGTYRSIKGGTWEFCHILSGLSELTDDGKPPVMVRAGDAFVMKPTSPACGAA